MENVLPLYVLLCAPDSVIKEGRVYDLGFPGWEVTSRCARVTEEREHAILFFMILGRKQYACLAMFAVCDAASVRLVFLGEKKGKNVMDKAPKLGTWCVRGA